MQTDHNMQEHVINKILELKGIADYVQAFKAYDFSDNTADELEELYSSVELLEKQADDTLYAICRLEELLDALRVERRNEEDEADYESESRHRRDLNSWWHGQRM